MSARREIVAQPTRTPGQTLVHTSLTYLAFTWETLAALRGTCFLEACWEALRYATSNRSSSPPHYAFSGVIGRANPTRMAKQYVRYRDGFE